MEYDVVIIGAGLSGVAAGIRLAHFGRRVLIAERHALPGGLNGYYRRRGAVVDVGLHALTNCAPASDRRAPLNRLLRQLRLDRDELDLRPQTFSTMETPGACLRFSNDPAVLEAGIAAVFPAEVDGFRRLVEAVRQRDRFSLTSVRESTRRLLPEFIGEPVLQDLLLLPLMFYGNAEENDMDFTQFCVLFESVFLEGFCRPLQGMQPIIDLLLRRYREAGGELRCRCGVRCLQGTGQRVSEVELDDGSVVQAGAVLSCAGRLETYRLLPPGVCPLPAARPGQLAYVETLFFLDRAPSSLGLESCISFVNRAARFAYCRPAVPVDLQSAVICCPGNYVDGQRGNAGRQIRLTHLADYGAWLGRDPAAYAAAKDAAIAAQRAFLEERASGVSAAVVDVDMFTPKTILRYTGHLNGSIYGTPDKQRDGRTPLDNLFLCGTDQGFLGIVGSLLSGVSIANAHLLS